MHAMADCAGGEGEEANARLLAETATQLVESSDRLERASRLLPTDEDFHFYFNFNEFREPVQGIEARVHGLLTQFSSLGVLSRAPALPSNPDDCSDWLVSMQDELLEQVDSAFDIFKKERVQQGLPPPENDAFMYQNTRKKRPRDMLTKETKPLPEVEGKAVSMQSEKCPVPFHVKSIPRPQDKFDAPVDNSNTPFRHPRLVSSSLPDAQPDVSAHPLQERLQSMTFEDVLGGVAEPKQPASLEETPFTFVNTPALLEDTAAKLALEREIAVDLEHHQFRSFQGLTCLMQISTRSEDFIIDTLELRSIIGRHLYDIFASPTIQKVMHGASLDLMWLQRDFGIYVCNLFDSGQAARVLELESFGLAHLLKRFCGFTPDKRYQMADWRLRPLPVEMLKYAREDTHYLLYVGDLLKKQLLSLQSKDQQKPLLEVLRRSRDLCLKLYEKEIITETSYLQVYGLEEMKFNPRQLAVLSGLYSWRDQVARVEDESTGYVLPNHLLLKLAEEMPEDVKQLRMMLNGRHTVVARNIATIVNIIKRMKSLPLPRRPVIESKPSLEVGTNKSPPVFEEVAFPEGSPIAAVVEDAAAKESNVADDASEFQGDQISSLGQRPNGIPGDCIAAAASKAAKGVVGAANVVLNRATKSSLYGMQKVRDKVMGRVEVSKDTDCMDSAAGGEKSLELTTSGVTAASGVVVKRASGSSFFLKTKKSSRVVQEVQDTSIAVKVESLEVVKTQNQESSSQGREVADLAFMLGNRTSLQSEVRGSIHSEDFEQAEAKSRAARVRASFSLPFHTFHGGDASAERAKVTAEKVFGAVDTTWQEPEDVILLAADTPEGSLERETETTPDVVRKGICIRSDGVQHRVWWPDSLSFAQEPSLDTMEEEPSDTSHSSSMQTEFPLPLSQKFRQQRGGNMQSKTHFSQLSTTNANDLQEEQQSYEHKNQIQERMASVVPFDYAAAKKNMGFFRGRSESNEQAEGSSPGGFNKGNRRESTEKIFDPQKRVKEYKPEGITPGKRRQVFPQSGNRTGVFK